MPFPRGFHRGWSRVFFPGPLSAVAQSQDRHGFVDGLLDPRGDLHKNNPKVKKKKAQPFGEIISPI
jgi:hypothetical protein